jgi:hypothetical protein
MVVPVAVASAILIALLLSPAQAVTTGQLTGFVVDEDGNPLPGVSVSASSPTQIGGVRVTETDLQGWFQYPRLIPGYFTVTLKLEGFLTQELTEVQVRLARTTQVRATMPPSTIIDAVTVTETTPVVDPERVSSGQTFTSDFMEEAVIGTDMRYFYWQVALLAAGVTGRGADGGPDWDLRVLGSAPQDNIFLVDGLDTSNPLWGGWQITLPFDAVQEVAFESGGFGANFGRGMGGVINAVTKSGSNSFKGSFDARYADSDFASSGEHFDPDESSASNSIVSATLGGRFVRDRAWFFGAIEHQAWKFTAQDAPTTETEDWYQGFFKVTGQVSPSWLALGKVQSSPYEFLGPSSPFRSPETNALTEITQSVLQAEVSGVLSDTMLWELQVGSQLVETEIGPASGNSAPVYHRNLDTNMRTGNYHAMRREEQGRDQIGTYLSWFVDDALGGHEFKFGAEYSSTSYQQDFCWTGLEGGGFCREGERGFILWDLTDPAGDSIPFLMRSLPAGGPYGSEGTLPAVFVNDSWRVRPNVTLQLGLRWDRSTFKDDEGDELASLEMLQPRLGATWDITQDGRNLLRASWGRYMDSSDLQVAWYISPWEEKTWLACSLPPELGGFGLTDPAECAAVAVAWGLDYGPDPEGWDPAGWLLINAYDSDTGFRVDRDLEPTYADTFILGYERELFRRTSLELSFVDKATRDIFDDTCGGNVPTPSPDADCSYGIITNIPQARRDYQAWILNFESRAIDRLHVLASYTYSDELGTHRQKSSNTSYFDLYPHHFVNLYGYLPSHRQHRIKASGYAQLPWDFGIGFSGLWGSPFQWTPVEQAVRIDPAAWGKIFLEPRGSREGDSWSQLDVQLTKGFSLGRTRLQLFGAVLNLFDSENATGVCNLIRGCGEYEMGDATEWQQPRRYELGMRVEF